MEKKYKEPKKIKLGEKIYFKWMDREHGRRSLGWAYFDVCQVWKYGKIKKIFIYPKQQHESKTFVYEVPEDYKAEMLYLGSYTGNDSEAVIWYNAYCKEHKAIMSSVRVPKESSYFTLSLHFGNSINMDFYKDAKEDKGVKNEN